MSNTISRNGINPSSALPQQPSAPQTYVLEGQCAPPAPPPSIRSTLLGELDNQAAMLRAKLFARFDETTSAQRISDLTPVPAARSGPVIDTPEQLAGLLASDADLRGATFNITLEPPLEPSLRLLYSEQFLDRDLSGAVFKQPVTDMVFDGVNLEGAQFLNNVTRSRFNGTNLANTRFTGQVIINNFVYADVSNVDFTGAVSLSFNDFAFTETASGTSLLIPLEGAVSLNAFAGTAYAETPLLSNARSLNDPDFLTEITGMTDPRDQANEIEIMVTNNSLYGQLRAELGDEAMNALLPPQWRSAIWDRLLSDIPVDLTSFGILKNLTFDAANGRYDFSYVKELQRPPGGPTLDYLYKFKVNNPDGEQVQYFKPIINEILGQMLLTPADSGASVTLADPFAGGITSAAFDDVTRLHGDLASPDVAAWLESEFNYNGQNWSVSQIVIPHNSELLETLGSLIPEEDGQRDRFEELSRGGLTVGQMQALGWSEAVHYVFDNTKEIGEMRP